ncbi:MAG: ABC transporter permease [Anaerolineales bacterium]|nr:ABC transporter permease [Anaerolineales bacterium]
MNKIFAVALKDLTRSFRSAFALIFMFAIPLLVPLLFLVMFGNLADEEQGFELPVTQVVVVNLDEGGAGFEQAMTNLPGGMETDSLGALVVRVLQSPDFGDLIAVRLETEPATARSLVDNQEAGVAIIIPADFSAQYAAFDGQAVLEFYQDPTLTIGPGVVKSILNQFMDGLSGARIAVTVSLARLEANDPAVIGQVIEAYMAAQQQDGPSAARLDVRTPVQDGPARSPVLVIVGMVMGAMLLFYAYYTGVATGQGILQEDEQLTLPRLFTTPTPPASILIGKFLGVLLTVTVQVIVLLIAARLIFRVDWGSPEAIAMTIVCVILNASAFGIFLNSLLKSTRQGGVLFGGVLTVTTWIGLLPIFVGFAGGSNPMIDSISLSMPQGWIGRMLLDSIANASLGQIALSGAVSLAWTALFFTIGIWRFGRRYV